MLKPLQFIKFQRLGGNTYVASNFCFTIVLFNIPKLDNDTYTSYKYISKCPTKEKPESDPWG